MNNVFINQFLGEDDIPILTFDGSNPQRPKFKSGDIELAPEDLNLLLLFVNITRSQYDYNCLLKKANLKTLKTSGRKFT